MRTVLVTGATSGLGRGLAVELAAAGWRVLVHGRDPERTYELAEETGATPYVADLASLAEVRRLAQDVRAGEERLDVLVNNAGVGFGRKGGPREVSADGHELRLAVNYLAPVLLTRELLGLLRSSAPSRVVNVGSLGQQDVDLDNVEYERGWSGVRAYCRAKLALAAWTFDLAERLRPDGVSVVCLHPGTYMPTRMVLEGGIEPVDSLEGGVAATLRLVEDVSGTTGEFYDVQRPARALEQAYDRVFRARLADVTDGLLTSG